MDDDAVMTSNDGTGHHIAVAGAGYAGLHVALRLAARLRGHPEVELTLVDRHDYHQVVTELPRVAGGTRAADAVRIPLEDVLASRVRFVRTEITGFDLAEHQLLTETVEAAERHGLPRDLPGVRLVEAGPTILAGSSPQLIDKAAAILADLGVVICTDAAVAAVTEEGFRLADGRLVEGGVFAWAGGVKAPELVAGSGLPTGHNGRVKVDRYLRVLDRPDIYVAGDLASVVDPRTGHALPPLAQIALEEGETVARNLHAELRGRPLEEFTFHDKGFVVSVGAHRGVAEVAGITSGGRLAHVLKDAIEWEYRESVKHLRGWDPVAR